MKYLHFEELPAWQAAISLAVRVYALTASDALRNHPGLRDQIERASVSISNNIAEGFERGTHQELLTFLYIARGSAGEVRSMLCLLEQLPGMGEITSEVADLKTQALSVSRQLGGWLESLKDSDHKGPRYQNQQTRNASQTTTKRKEFLNHLRQIQTDGNPSLKPPEDPPPS